MILSTDEKSRRKALQKLLPMQRADFAGLFKAMDGYPVVIRTLDPPLHEFVPKREELMVDLAKLPNADGKLKKEMAARYKMAVGDLKKGLPELLKRVEELHEFKRDAGSPRLPFGHHVSRDHGDAGACDLRSRCAGGEEGREGDSGSDDSADWQRAGAGESEGDREGCCR
jgi:hypothetical protein